MAIEFLPIIESTTDYPLYFSSTLKGYDGLNDGEYTMEYQNDCVVSYMSLNNPSYHEVAFQSVSTSSGFSFLHVTGNPAAGQTKNVCTLLLGKGNDGTKVELIAKVLCFDQYSTSLSWFLTIDLKLSRPNQTPVISHVMTESGMGMLYTPSAAGSILNIEYLFGLGLVQIPGRPTSLDNKCLAFFYGARCTGLDLDYVPLSHYSTAQDGTRRYDVRPGVNRVDRPAQGSSYMTLGCLIDLAQMARVYSVLPSLDVFSPEAGWPSGPGGMEDGSFDRSSDSVAIPTEQTTGATSLGFYHIYKMSLSSLQNLGYYVFGEDYSPYDPGQSDDLVQAMKNLFNAITGFGKNATRSRLVDYIVSLHTIPVEPNVSESGIAAVQLGGRTLDVEDHGVSGVSVTSDYKTFDCGTISLAEYSANFADFYENCKLFLPFIGFVSARPEWFKGTSLNVTYRFNVIDGSCIAFVSSTGRYVNNANVGTTVVGQFSGTASIRYPVTCLSYAGMATGVIGAMGGMATAVGAGSTLGIAASAMNLSQSRPDIVQSNGFNSCSAMMGVRRPFLLIERPEISYSENYQHEIGIPANITDTLGNVSGFVKMENVHLEGIDLTEREKEELRVLLANGVIN